MRHQQKIAQVIAMLHTGIGLEDASFQGTWHVITDKLLGDVPFGADAPDFITRKRMVLSGFYGELIFNGIVLLLVLLLLLLVSLMLWASYPQIDWFIYGVELGLICWLLIITNKITYLVRLIVAIKPIKPQYSSPMLNKSPYRLEKDENKSLSSSNLNPRNLRKARFITRLLAVLMMIITGYFLFNFYQHPQIELTKQSAILPFLFMFGLGLFIHPLTKAESLHLYGVTQIPFKYIPIKVKLCWLLGAIASVAMFINHG